MGVEKDQFHYDSVYKSGGWKGLYFKDADLIQAHYPSWKCAYQFMLDNDIKFVYDFGCGPGHFSSLFKESDNIEYVGFDFSMEALEQAIARNSSNKNNKFFFKDLSSYDPKENNKRECKFFTAFEFLEHVSFDLEILSKLKKGDEIIFSVPNYDSAGHVRHFKDHSEVVERYGDLFYLKKMSTTEQIYGPHKIFIYYGKRK